MLLAGDIGGTKTLLGLYHRAPERPLPIAMREFTTLAYDSIGAMVREFLAGGARERVEAAAFGVAGVVRREIARLTNVPWVVDADQIVEEFDVPSVTLLNDLEAMAYAVSALEGDELALLQDGEAQPEGNAALIAAGTGLGEALLHNVDGRFIPSPSEGGHADFAPRTTREIELLVELVRNYGRAEYEQVASGIGLVNLFRFAHRGPCPSVADPSDVAALPAALTSAALARRCPSCVEALDIFVSVYGAEAGNLALRSVATAGLYVGGGIAPKILPALESGAFIAAFRDKPPMADLLATIPVYVILNRHAGLLGAAVYANGAPV
ncbi:MAG TPA: glucokinase [Vicinamibacterales bacterium]|nr:glucokinase [Vicinamibacterales bacterium]